ncbi:MAG: endonuclease Q family protein [Candidatus Jacksonbacteria bacterium]
MQIIADLHVHSKYSRATSPDLTPEGLYKAAKIKAVDIIGTGDFTHPQYLSELKEQLKESPEHPGFFCLKKTPIESKFPLFMLTTEVSCIYSQDGRGRRNHIIITVPDFKTADKLIANLSARGFNLSSDGRPILGASSEELAKIALDINSQNLVIPSHIWTPWFSTYGSKSGFDSLEQCFGSMTKYILAIETGLSSDPSMNWRIKELDNFAIISNGDAHSSRKVAREATVFELENVSYQNIIKALKNSAKLNKNNLPQDYIKYTIEFYPEEGKYHWDGHRACDVRLSPWQSREEQNICPKCRKPLTLGVMHRVDALSSRTEKQAQDYARRFRPGFKKIVPLEEIVADALGQGTGTKKVRRFYDELIQKGDSELKILLDLSYAQLKKITLPEIAEGIKRVRNGQLHVNPGFDGVFGQVKVFTKDERERIAGAQARLF